MWLHLQLLPFLGESHSMQRQPHCFCQVIWWFGTIDAASYAGYSRCRCGHLRLYDTSLVIWNRQWVWTGWNVARIGMRLQMGERKTGEAKAYARSHRTRAVKHPWRQRWEHKQDYKKRMWPDTKELLIKFVIIGEFLDLDITNTTWTRRKTFFVLDCKIIITKKERR